MNTMHDPLLLKRDSGTELYLIRHGDAIPEADEIIPSGVYDNLPLSKTGRDQARNLAERLKEYKFDAVYSSPLRRCLETGAPLLTYLDKQPTILEGLKEIRLIHKNPLPTFKEGEDLAPLSKAIRERQAETTTIAAITGTWDSVTKEETSQGFRQRVVKTMDGIASHHIGERILVLTHGGVINAYVAEVLGLSREFFFPCANTSLTIVRSTGERRVLYVLNDVAHLKLL